MTDQLTHENLPRSGGHYENFRDPVGLLRRMLFSGNRAAYESLVRAILTYGCTPLDRFWQKKEQRYLDSATSDEAAYPLVCIVGPPRSGSTLLYQAMARYTDVSYFSNLTALFPRSPIAATRLVQGLPEQKKNLRNFYGQTEGWSSPNDGFPIWNRWLGANRYGASEVMPPADQADMRRFFSAWTHVFRKPFLNKNNRNTYCIELLANTLPQAYFVVIRRDPRFVAQSLIRAREMVQGSKHRSWGLASTEKNTRAKRPLGYVDDVCEQIIQIETRLKQQLGLVSTQQYVETTYQQFCENPTAELENIACSIPQLVLRQERITAELSQFPASATMRLSSAEQERIEQRLSVLPAPHMTRLSQPAASQRKR